MKVLHLDSYFLLPDDFDGDANDALRELIKYRESKNLKQFKACTKEEMGIEKDTPWNMLSDGDKWNVFLKGINDGFKHIGKVSLAENTDDGWKEYD